MKSFTILPFLGLLVAAYAIIAILGPGTFGDYQGMSDFLGRELFRITSIPSVSEANPLTLTTGDVLVTIGLVLLAFEIIKATNTGMVSLLNHIFSGAVFVVSIVLFVAVPNFGTMTFFLITMMTFVDFMGMIVTIITARRDIGVPGLA